MFLTFFGLKLRNNHLQAEIALIEYGKKPVITAKTLPLKAFERLLMSFERLSMSVERLSASFESMSMSVERLSTPVERLSTPVE